jgi:uncharacterized integral membrane protein
MGPFDRLRDRESGEEGKRESEKVGKRESVLEEQCAESEALKPQRGDIIIEGDITIESDIVIDGDDITANDLLNTGDTTSASEAEKPQRGHIAITSPRAVITAVMPAPISNTTQIFEHKKSQALEGAGKVYLLGLITLVILIALVIFLVSNGAVTAVLVSLIVGLTMALGIYLLLFFAFIALLMFIIKTFGS